MISCGEKWIYFALVFPLLPSVICDEGSGTEYMIPVFNACWSCADNWILGCVVICRSTGVVC